MPEAAYGHGGWKAVRPLEPIGAQMNVAYAVAVALLGRATCWMTSSAADEDQ